jgi:putative phage-type endonuclease
MVEELRKPSVPIAHQGTALWLLLRGDGIGASEVAAACGICPYQQPIELYAKKRAVFEGRDPEQDKPTLPMRHGTHNEPLVKQLFEEWNGGTPLMVPNPAMYKSEDHSHRLASPDAIVSPGVLLECKTASAYGADKWGDGDEIPVNYLAQVQWQMGIMNAHKCYVAVLIGNSDFRVYEIERSQPTIDGLYAKVDAFWQRVLDGNPPDVDYARPGAYDAIKHSVQKITGEVCELPEDLSAKWQRSERIGSLIGKLKAKQEQIKAEVLYRMGENGAAVMPDGRMLRRKIIEKKSFTVAASRSLDLRAVKYDGSPITGSLVNDTASDDDGKEGLAGVAVVGQLQGIGCTSVAEPHDSGAVYAGRVELPVAGA